MEEKEKSGSNVFSYIIIALLSIIMILLLLNLGATTFLIFKSQQTVAANGPSGSKPLPAKLNSAKEKERLFESLKEPFNAKDNDKLYSLLDPVAQLEIPKEDFEEQLSLIYGFSGNIEDGVYSHYDYMGNSRGRDWFYLYYKLKTENGPADLRVTVAQEGNEPYTTWGLHINK